MGWKLVAIPGFLALILTGCGEDSTNNTTTNSTVAGANEGHCACPEPPQTDMGGSTAVDKVRSYYKGSILEYTEGKWVPLTCPEACPTNTKLTRQYEKAVRDEILRTWKLSEHCTLSDLARGKAKREIYTLGDLPYSGTEMVSIVGALSIGAEWGVSRKTGLDEIMADLAATAVKAPWTSIGVGCGVDPKTNELMTVVLFNQGPSDAAIEENAVAVTVKHPY